MLAPMRGRRSIPKLAAVAAAIACATIAAATPAHAALYTFHGDEGTRCTVEVGAKASDSLGALSGPPQVGYSSVTSCGYRPSRADGAKRPARGRRPKAKRCAKGKRGGAKRAAAAGKKRGCKRKNKKKRRRANRAGSRRAGALPVARAAVAGQPVGAAALHEAPASLVGSLELIGPFGVAGVGERTAAVPDPGAFACGLPSGVACADQGRLIPALPGAEYTARFELTLRPPPGEAWASRPGGCGTEPVASCTLTSATVSPTL
jgi:hypothetical protein